MKSEIINQKSNMNRWDLPALVPLIVVFFVAYYNLQAEQNFSFIASKLQLGPDLFSENTRENACLLGT